MSQSFFEALARINNLRFSLGAENSHHHLLAGKSRKVSRRFNLNWQE